MATIFDGICGFGRPYVPRWERDTADASAEFLGTLMFAFFGGLATDGAAGNGAALAALVYCCAAVSGGKLNPAVSLAAALADRGSSISVSVAKVLYEWAAQLTGALSGAALANALTPGGGNGCFLPKNGASWVQVAGLEAFGTALLVSTVLAVAVEPTGNARFGQVAPLAIGLSLYAAAEAAGSWTGGCMNPARFIGSAGAGGCSGQWKGFAAYVLGELAGALLASAVHAARDAARARVLEAACVLPEKPPRPPGGAPGLPPGVQRPPSVPTSAAVRYAGRF